MAYEFLVMNGKVVAYPEKDETPPILSKPCPICLVYALVPRKGEVEGFHCVNCEKIAEITGLPRPNVEGMRIPPQPVREEQCRRRKKFG